jgi:hypothetical protein
MVEIGFENFVHYSKLYYDEVAKVFEESGVLESRTGASKRGKAQYKALKNVIEKLREITEASAPVDVSTLPGTGALPTSEMGFKQFVLKSQSYFVKVNKSLKKRWIRLENLIKMLGALSGVHTEDYMTKSSANAESLYRSQLTENPARFLKAKITTKAIELVKMSEEEALKAITTSFS